MSDLKPVRVQSFDGGLNLAEKSIIGDNQLSVATNMYYDTNKILTTRRGQTAFGNPVPDAVKLIHNCDSTSANGTWAATDDAVNLTASTSQVKRGAAALNFDITVATSGNNFATLTNSTLTAVDISTVKGAIGFWVFVPTGAKTNLTDLRLRVGSSAANYYEFTIALASLTEGRWNFLYSLYSGATVTGSPNDAAINYLLFRVNYSAGYTNQAGWGLDDIVSYSSTYSKAVMSLKYFKANTTAATRYLLCSAGTSLFEYEENTQRWTLVKTGLTDGLRFGMSVYKNIMNFSNGTDNYFSYNGTVATEHTGANTYKGKYLLMANDVGYILGDPSVPSSLAYTNATPSNLQTYPNVLVLDEDDSSGKGTGLINLGPVIIAGKDKKIYQVNIATPSRQQLDYSDGIKSHRSLIRVENEVFIRNESGYYTLSQREATTGSLRADALSFAIQPMLDQVANTNIGTSAGLYNPDLKNVYFWEDIDSNDTNDSTFVFSVLTKSWTTYTGIAANEGVVWEDSTGGTHFLVASSITGKVVEIETGYNDNDVEIACRVETKNFDLGLPETLKTFEYIDVFGFCSENAEIQFNSIIDDTTETTAATIYGTTYAAISSAVSFAYASYAYGTAPYAGQSSSSGVALYPFKARIPLNETGTRIRLKLASNKKDSVWSLTKAHIYPYPQPLDYFEVDFTY